MQSGEPDRSSDSDALSAWSQGEWETRWSSTTSALSWRTELLPDILEEALERGWIPPESTVLDIGCGSGEITRLIAERGFKVLGIDFAPSAIRRAREASPPVDGLEFAVADICSTEFDLRKFDVLLDRGCLHTIRGEQRLEYARGLDRVSRDGTRYLLMHKFPDPDRYRRNPSEVQQRAEMVLRTMVERSFTLLDSRSIELQRAGGLTESSPMPGIALLFERFFEE